MVLVLALSLMAGSNAFASSGFENMESSYMMDNGYLQITDSGKVEITQKYIDYVTESYKDDPNIRLEFHNNSGKGVIVSGIVVLTPVPSTTFYWIKSQ